MIFNINSTRGQTRFLTSAARVTCLVYINLRRSRYCLYVWGCGDVFLLRASLTYFGDLLRCPHNERVHRKTQYTSGIDTITYKLATSLTFETLCVGMWQRLGDVSLSVSYALHLLILWTCYTVHINASSL